MNLPNRITLGRLGFTAACFALLESVRDPVTPPPVIVWWAFGLFLFATATDFVDGWVARRFGQVTALGRILDPFCDKVLICGALVCLLRFPAASVHLSSWMVVVVVSREFLVTAVRGLAEKEGMAFPADQLGKAKMLIQSVTAAALMADVAGATWTQPIAAVGVWVTVVVTAISGANYLVKARKVLRED